MEALVLATDENSSVSESVLHRTGYSSGKVQAIRREIELGESRRRDIDGVPPELVRGDAAPPNPRAAPFRHRPGQRRAIRDPVPVEPSPA